MRLLDGMSSNTICLLREVHQMVFDCTCESTEEHWKSLVNILSPSHFRICKNIVTKRVEEHCHQITDSSRKQHMWFFFCQLWLLVLATHPKQTDGRVWNSKLKTQTHFKVGLLCLNIELAQNVCRALQGWVILGGTRVYYTDVIGEECSSVLGKKWIWYVISNKCSWSGFSQIYIIKSTRMPIL